MAMTRKTITIPHSMERWIKTQIKTGRYASDSEYFRDLIRHDQERSGAVRALRRALEDGLASGRGTRSVEDIWAEAERKSARRNG